jgi:hypothetical protein
MAVLTSKQVLVKTVSCFPHEPGTRGVNLQAAAQLSLRSKKLVEPCNIQWTVYSTYKMTSQNRSYFTTDSMPWCRPHCGTCKQIFLPVGMFLCGALSDKRTGLQFAMQSLNGPSRTEPVTILYCLIWDSPNLEGQVHVFTSHRNSGPVILLGTGFPLPCLLPTATKVEIL